MFKRDSVEVVRVLVPIWQSAETLLPGLCTSVRPSSDLTVRALGWGPGGTWEQWVKSFQRGWAGKFDLLP